MLSHKRQVESKNEVSMQIYGWLMQSLNLLRLFYALHPDLKYLGSIRALFFSHANLQTTLLVQLQTAKARII